MEYPVWLSVSTLKMSGFPRISLLSKYFQRSTFKGFREGIEKKNSKRPAHVMELSWIGGMLK